ncbi:hypothetical protein [Streptosporangium sp. KLBMP 9127]|nr:hypothetical protein [Streptosporangium sp. KLBMP 9127]
MSEESEYASASSSLRELKKKLDEAADDVGRVLKLQKIRSEGGGVEQLAGLSSQSNNCSSYSVSCTPV